jgi:hypothetical protein
MPCFYIYLFVCLLNMLSEPRYNHTHYGLDPDVGQNIILTHKSPIHVSFFQAQENQSFTKCYIRQRLHMDNKQIVQGHYKQIARNAPSIKHA